MIFQRSEVEHKIQKNINISHETSSRCALEKFSALWFIDSYSVFATQSGACSVNLKILLHFHVSACGANGSIKIKTNERENSQHFYHENEIIYQIEWFHSLLTF